MVTDFIFAYETFIRLFFFLIVFFFLVLSELWFPWRAACRPKINRWLSHFSLLVFYSILLRILFPVAAVGVAHISGVWGVGILNWVALPSLATFLIALLALDAAIYGQHRLMHVVPWLWRLHRMHHTDLDFDVTTGFRFHPVEIVISMLFKCVVVVILGPSVLAVLVFEILLSVAALFTHANIGLSNRVDRYVRWVFVTPNMHRIHHSVKMGEYNSNYGFFISVWDRLFGSYCSRFRGEEQIGLPSWNDDRDVVSFWGLLVQPFRPPR